MKIATRRRIAAGLALTLGTTVAAVVVGTSSSSASVVSVNPTSSGNYAPQPTTVTFQFPPADTPTGDVFGTKQQAIPNQSVIRWTRSGTSDLFKTRVASNTPDTNSLNQVVTTSVDFSNVPTSTSATNSQRKGPANPGTYDVQFYDPNDTTPLDGCTRCFAVTAAAAPTVTALSPNKIAAGAPVTNVNITGTNFARGTTFEVLPVSGNSFNDVKVEIQTSSGSPVAVAPDGRTFPAKITVPAAATLGVRDVRVTNTDGQTSTCTACFTVLGANLTGVSPSVITNNDSDNARTLIISAPPGAIAPDGIPSLTFVGDPGGSTRDALTIPATSVTSRAGDGSSITAVFDFSAVAPTTNSADDSLAFYQPTISSSTGGTVNVCSCKFEVTQPSTPTVTSLSPSSQDPNTVQTVTVGGTNFARGTNILVAGGGVTTTAVEFIDRTQVKATFSVASSAASGARTVTATLTDGKVSAACNNCYAIKGASASPGASSTSTPRPTSTACPTTGSTASGTPVASSTASGTPTASSTATGTPTATASSTATASTTASPTASSTASPTATASTTASPTSTATPRPSASSCPAPTRQTLTLTTSDTNIPAGSTATLRASGQPNQAYSLQCYTRPSTSYAEARSGSFDAAGSPVTFTLSLGRNTRCFLQYATNSTQGQSPSIVINVRTVLSLSTVRTATRTYVFQGRNLPRVAGQLITLYRVDAAGNEIRTSNLVTDDSGIYRVTRKFTGTGTFRFKVRTSQTLNNAAGVSNTISVTVR